MKFLGFEIRKSAAEISTSAQFRDNSPQGPLTSAFNNWVFRKIDPKFFEVMREAIPMCDTAINKLVSMNGKLEIIGDNAECVKELEDFCLSVPVGPVQHGIDAYRAAIWGEGFEQGFGYGELIATPDLKDIEGLRVADSKYIIYWKNAAGMPEPWYLYPDKDTNSNRPLIDPAELIGRIVNARYGQTLNYNEQDMVKLNPANKFYLAPRVENSNPYGIALFRSIPWVAQILATLQNSIKNSADRFGDPMYHMHASGKTASDKITKLLDDLTKQLNNAIAVKRQGGSADIVTAGGENSKVDIKVIGHEGQLFLYEIPLRNAEESIVAASGLPGWVLGKYWSTTERMAQLEVEVVLADAAMRNTNETPGLIRLFSAVLAMRGKKWKTVTTDPNKPGDWGFRFISPNLHNEVASAQARFLNAQAGMMERGGGPAGQPIATVRNTDTEVPVGQAYVEIEGMKFPLVTAPRKALTTEGAEKSKECGCGKVHSEIKNQNSKPGAKELQRPIPWPKLDKIEADYETELKYDWNELRQKVFKIAKLDQVAGKNKKDILPADQFTFTDEQRKSVMDALKEYLGYYDPQDPDSSVRWAYMQAYSAGLIQAANLVGKERPLLDILKNKEIFDQLVQNGFNLVKDNATIAIKDRVIAAMQSGVTNGDNPFSVAGTLNQAFDDQNSSWERLARTEMGSAAENAKKDEWDARENVDTSGFINGPAEIHPRCKCSNTVEDDGNGNFKVVFVPAPDACDACFAAAEGTKSV